jgi:hypothetical protein
MFDLWNPLATGNQNYQDGSVCVTCFCHLAALLTSSFAASNKWSAMRDTLIDFLSQLNRLHCTTLLSSLAPFSICPHHTRAIGYFHEKLSELLVYKTFTLMTFKIHTHPSRVAGFISLQITSYRPFLDIVLFKVTSCHNSLEQYYGSDNVGPKPKCRKNTNSLALSPQANYTDWATATCQRNLVPTFVDRGVSPGQRSGSLTVVKKCRTWNIKSSNPTRDSWNGDMGCRCGIPQNRPLPALSSVPPVLSGWHNTNNSYTN